MAQQGKGKWKRRLRPHELQANAGNMVAEAIRRLGGPTQTVVATGVTSQTWDRWRRLESIQDVKVLFRVAELTGIAPQLLAGPPKPKTRKPSVLSSGKAAPPRAARKPLKAGRARLPAPPIPATA